VSDDAATGTSAPPALPTERIMIAKRLYATKKDGHAGSISIYTRKIGAYQP